MNSNMDHNHQASSSRQLSNQQSLSSTTNESEPEYHPQREGKEARSKVEPMVLQSYDRMEANNLAYITTNQTINSTRTTPPPPDGGLKAWTQVAMGWIIIFATWGFTNSFGSFQAYYISTLPQPASTISWIGAVQVFLNFSISAFSGRALDAGFYLPTFIFGATCQVAGIFLMSISKNYWNLMLTQGVLTGIGGGIISTPALALVATYFQERRGVAIGLLTTGNSLGGMIYPLVVREMIPRAGFGWAARVLGFLNLGGFILVAIFMRPRLPPRKSGPLIDWTAFTDPIYMTYVSGLFCFVWSVYYTFSYLGSYGREHLGMPYSSATLLITVLNGTGLPTRIGIPFLADRIGPLNTLAPVTCCVAIVSYTWLAVSNVTGIYVFTVFYGLASGAFQCLMPTGIASITKRLNTVGTRMGMAFSIASIAGLTGPPLGGQIQTADHGNYRGAQVWASLASTLAAVFMILARFQKAEWRLRAKC